MCFLPLRSIRVGAALRLASLLGVSLLVSLPLAAQANNSSDGIDSEQSDRELLEREALLLKQLSEGTDGEIGVKEEKRAAARTRSSSSSSSSAPKVVAARAIAASGEPSEQPSKPDQSAQIAQLQGQISDKEKRIDALVDELGQVRNRLLLAETEVERLSAIIQERNRKQLSSAGAAGSAAALSVNPVAKTVVKPASRAPAPRAAAEPDMQIITVSADKAYLRTGPGMNNSPLMTVSRGTRLAVETRQGEWYRVISPAGTRAWIASDVVIFGELSGTARSTRMGGFDSEAEARAFELIKNTR